MIILGLTGENASGKGTVAEYLVKKYKVKQFRFSKILDDILDRISLPHSRYNESHLAMSLRELFGYDILAQVLTKDIVKEKLKLSLVDGMRFKNEYKLFKTIPGFKLIYVTAPVEMRYEKAKKRGEKPNEDTLTLQQFKKIEKTSRNEKDIPSLGKLADFRIDNTGTKQELYRKVDEIMKQIKK